jgi:acylphosphatase
MSIPGGFRFEVWGKVQGVYFRKYAHKQAEALGVSGWIRNHKGRGTVQGEVASPDVQSRNQMKVWLQSQGSPMSLIEKADFETLVDTQSVADLIQSGTFEIRRSSGHYE